jgi:hypothetical protein
MWWHNWRYLPHMKDEALSPATFLIETLSIADPGPEERARAAAMVTSLVDVHENAASARTALTDWYRAEHGLDRIGRALADPFILDIESFVAELRSARGRRRPLSPADVAAARAAWRESVAPVRDRLREAERLERELSGLVNASYGITPDEARLMWETAPPRMPPASPQETTSPAAAA